MSFSKVAKLTGMYMQRVLIQVNSEKDVLAVLHQCGLDLVGHDVQLLLLFCF